MIAQGCERIAARTWLFIGSVSFRRRRCGRRVRFAGHRHVGGAPIFGTGGPSDRAHIFALADFVGVHSAGFASGLVGFPARLDVARSEEHTSELQSLMRISYAVFCLTKKNSTQV